MDPIVQTESILAMLEKLVKTESPSSNKRAVDRVGNIITQECRRIGAQVIIHPQVYVGDHVEVRWELPSQKHPVRGKNGILILCHMDTVYPIGTLENMPYHEIDGKLYGPGVADMKGGISVALNTIFTLKEKNRLTRKMTLLFTSDEEIGSQTSRSIIERLAIDSELVLVLEPGMPDGALKTWRKGVGNYTVQVHGRAAHAGGNHKDGRNAIEEIANQILIIQKLTNYEQGTTLNTGMIQGGIAANVVPDKSVLEVDLRITNLEEADRIDRIIKTLHPIMDGTSIDVQGGINRPPMPFNDTMKTTFEKARIIAKNAGIDLIASGTGGASDANFIAPLGIPLLDGLGPAGGEYHSAREYIFTESLQNRATLLSAIIQGWE